MSWGAVGKAATDSFKQGYQNRKQTRDEVGGQSYGGASAPMQPVQPVQPAPAPDPMMTVGAQQPAPAQQQSPLIALLHAIWQRPTATR